MVHYFIGNAGHLLVILSFVLALASAFAYFKAFTAGSLTGDGWKLNGRTLFYLHAASVVGVIVALFLIIYNHYFEYHYAYAHSSRSLPVHYIISSFWEGQEGSFLLWIFWNCLLGLILIRVNRRWEAPLMTVFGIVQAFLSSMILGVVLFDLKIGSSPFMLLRDVVNDPIFQINPDFIPADGTGLNPLLQNYWMVIHPPTLFLGYASTLVPFAYLMAGLWMKEYRDWIRPAIPWAVFSTAMMALGQIMGAYWAYETLSFGGYWSWDPVENAVYVPWIVQVASIHTMIIYRKNHSALKISMLLVMATFLLVLYATFLTRSGILGNASVHSFTDLGLSGQLLIYLLSFLAASVVLIAYRWKELPRSEKEISVYSREFWIFSGATVLGLMGFQVLVPTSIPVFNALLEAVGLKSNMAPPADQALFYSRFQLWGGMLIAVLSALGQYIWWKNLRRENLWEVLALPVIASLLLSSAIFVLAGIHRLPYMLLLTAALYSVISNGHVLLGLLRKKETRLAGGAVAHLGIALMLIGILFSAGYSKVISLNRSGLLYSKEMTDEMNRENVLLFIDEPREMDRYELVYRGQRLEVAGMPGLIGRHQVDRTDEPAVAVAREELQAGGKTYYRAGDTLRIRPENTYYEVEYRRDGEKLFSLFPRAQVNPSMGLIVSPDILRSWRHDMYTHISSIPDPNLPVEWRDTTTHQVGLGERFFVNDFVATFRRIEQLETLDGDPIPAGDVAVKAIVEVFGKTQSYTAEPVFVIQGNRVGHIPSTIPELGLQIQFTNIDPQAKNFEFVTLVSQKDYVIMKAILMPWINLLWIGTLVLMLGFGISIRRRYLEFRSESAAT
jgi:cytochrome c-type biogenesis protein CcmF